MNVLTEVAKHPNGTLAGEVAAALNMPAPSANHLLNTLRISGILTKGEDRRYRLGPLVGALSSAYYLNSAPDKAARTAAHRTCPGRLARPRT